MHRAPYRHKQYGFTVRGVESEGRWCGVAEGGKGELAEGAVTATHAAPSNTVTVKYTNINPLNNFEACSDVYSVCYSWYQAQFHLGKCGIFLIGRWYASFSPGLLSIAMGLVGNSRCIRGPWVRLATCYVDLGPFHQEP